MDDLDTYNSDSVYDLWSDFDNYENISIPYVLTAPT